MIGQIDKATLHAMVDQLPECEWAAIHQALLERLAEHDPVLRALLYAPEEEPEEDEIKAIDEGHGVHRKRGPSDSPRGIDARTRPWNWEIDWEAAASRDFRRLEGARGRQEFAAHL